MVGRFGLICGHQKVRGHHDDEDASHPVIAEALAGFVTDDKFDLVWKSGPLLHILGSLAHLFRILENLTECENYWRLDVINVIAILWCINPDEVSILWPGLSGFSCF